MSSDDVNEAIAVLRNVEGYSGLANDQCSVVRLGGLTNRVFRVDTGADRLIVRIAGAGTGEYIDRQVELHNARAAHGAGVSADVIWADPASGLMVSREIPGIVTMTPALFSARPGSPARAGKALRKLHMSGETFEFRFELFSMIDDYLKILSGKSVQLPEGYHEIVAAAEPVKQALVANPAELAPCHCDPLCENFLDDGDVMWIVDWEYSGMNDPLWDVGDLSVEGGFSPEQDTELMEAYFGRMPTHAEHGRIVIYKAMCDLLWTLWGLIQLAENNPAEDFWAYSVTRFERCKTLMRDGSFQAHLDAVANTRQS